MTASFHEQLEALRKRSGLSYELVAQRVETNPSYGFRLCKGGAKPSRDFVIRLCLALNLGVVEADELLLSARHLGLLDTRSPGHSEPARSVSGMPLST